MTTDQLAALRRLDTCTVANAIETFGVRLRNEGYCCDASVRCLFPKLPAVCGHAVTVKIRCSSPPPDVKEHSYYDRTDWWNEILKIPAPRVVAIQDVDEKPGTGSFIGAVHANILLALGCIGAVTNGAVRDLPGVESAGFQLFAGQVSVSHAYSHIVSIGGEVAIGGLKIRPGDLLHGDLHGVANIPQKIAGELPAAAARLAEKERRIIALCRGGEFSLEKLRAEIRRADGSGRS